MPNESWKKSSRCDTGTCVEVRALEDEIQLRDSKLGNASEILRFNPKRWATFLADIATRTS